MLFNSIEFAIFFPIVFLIYWFLFKGQTKQQNIFIVFSSYFFYGSWDWRFLGLIVFSTLLDYTLGLKLKDENRRNRRRICLWTSIIVNLGFLAYFKYYNFFVESFVDTFLLFGKELNVDTLKVILPVGISFYTFQTLSYTIDVYKKKMEPTKDLIAFAAFVCFFPQLVAGPIERATNLLPQFYTKRTFDYYKAVDGLRQILWGLFKKIVIADNSAQIANEVFNNYDSYPGSTLLIGAFFFAFQIYGDFSGYSDIAIGSSRLLGFNLKQNFAFPYFSRDMAEFWRRWHISLSTWFRDYLYIPLGGSKGGVFQQLRNTAIIFIVSGFWHGANWTFVAWGAINALYFFPLLLLKRNRKNTKDIAEGRLLPSYMDVMKMSLTFFLTMIAWVFFRADSINVAFDYLAQLFSETLFEYPSVNLPDYFALQILLLICFFIVVEWVGRSRLYAIEHMFIKSSRGVRFFFYTLIVLLIALYMGDEQVFIYFQF